MPSPFHGRDVRQTRASGQGFIHRQHQQEVRLAPPPQDLHVHKWHGFQGAQVREKVVGMGPGDSSKSDRRVWKSVCSVQSRGPGWNCRREGAWFGIL
jgi:hypothetical protein